MVVKSELPPYVTKRRGTPEIGKSAHIIATFMSTCMAMYAAKPAARNRPKGSRAIAAT